MEGIGYAFVLLGVSLVIFAGFYIYAKQIIDIELADFKTEHGIDDTTMTILDYAFNLLPFIVLVTGGLGIVSLGGQR